MERIVRAAVRFPGAEQEIFEGFCHDDCYNIAREHGLRIDYPGAKEGFLTSEGRFVDRLEAGKIAFSAGQIKEVKRLASYDIELWKETYNG